MMVRNWRSVFMVLVWGLVASLVIPIGAASAAPSDVVISEIMYQPAVRPGRGRVPRARQPGSRRRSTSPAGASPGITLTFPTGHDDRRRTPGSSSSPDAARFQATYGFDRRLRSTPASSPTAGRRSP